MITDCFLFLKVASRVQKYFIKLAKAGLPVPGRMPNLPRPGNRVSVQKLVFLASVLLLIMNFVITDYFDKVMTKFIVNNRAGA